MYHNSQNIWHCMVCNRALLPLGQPLEKMTLLATLSALLQWLPRVNSLSMIIPTANAICMAQKRPLTLAAIVMKREDLFCQSWQTVRQASLRHAQ